MLDKIAAMLLVDAFWFSFILIGYALLTVARTRLAVEGPVQRLAVFCLRQQLILRSIFALGASFVVFGLATVICYVFELPVAVLSIAYGLVLAVSVIWLLLLGYRSLKRRESLTLKVTLPLHRQASFYLMLVTVIAAGLVLVADFAGSSYIGSEAMDGSDAYVHLSKITAIVNQGFSLQDGYFSHIVESRYHVNIVHAMYALGAWTLHMQPSEVWQHSLAFFRLLVWSSFFSFAYYAARNWLKQDRNWSLLLASLAVIAALSKFTGWFFVANYPNQIVTAWMVLFVILLSQYVMRNVGALGLLLTAFLITLTHPTYSLATALFVLLFIALRLLFQRRKFLKSRKDLLVYLASVGILMLSPVVTLLFPDRMTDESFSFGDFATSTIAGLKIFKPGVPQDLTGMAILIVCTLGLAALVYNARKNKDQLLLVLALVLFFPLIAYNPLTFGLISEHLPLWLIDRFRAMNIFMFISFPFGAYAVVKIGARIFKGVKISTATRNALQCIVIILLVLAFSAKFIKTTYRSFMFQHNASAGFYGFMDRTHNDFGGILNNNKVVVASIGDSYFLPAVASIDVVAIYDAHATPVADSQSRLKCQEKLIKSFSYSDLRAVNADYVVLAKYAAEYNADRAKLNKLPYLSKTAENSELAVFAVNKNMPQTTAADKACSQYNRVEAE